MSTWILLNAIGHSATLQLQRELGGGHVAIRAHLTDEDPLVKVLGRHTAEQLVAKLRHVPECTMGRIYVGRSLVRQERNFSILADRRGGMDIRSIAQRHHVTVELVRKILHDYADELAAGEE